jgi:hypothetical protein
MEGMSSQEDALLEQEVSELTELLRTDPAWEGLRQAIRSKGFQVEHLMLAAFMEDGEHHEWGALVAQDGRVYLYERETKAHSVGFVSFDESDVQAAIELHPAVTAALRAVGSGG